VLSFHSPGILSALKILLKRLVNHLIPISSKVSFSGNNHVKSFFFFFLSAQRKNLLFMLLFRKFITRIPNKKKKNFFTKKRNAIEKSNKMK
jgi:hypothetical protein